MNLAFILAELNNLAKNHPHRIQDVCNKLHNNREKLLAYVNVLNEKFLNIANKFKCEINLIWDMCNLQRYNMLDYNYNQRAEILESSLGELFDPIEDEVLEALGSTERTSSMVENLNSRIRPYLYLFENVSNDYLHLLRFYLNHTPFIRSAREHRVNKTPFEILSGKPHEHWLNMLGHTQFRRAA